MSSTIIKQAFALLSACAVLVPTMSVRAADADDRILSSFNKSYAYKTFLKDDAIRTESKNGVVTLTGQVNDASHKYLAQEALAGLPGVRQVDNRLEVSLDGAEQSDTSVRATVRSVLALHRKLSDCGAEVDIKDGVITLRGVATSETQKELATEYAGDVRGVLRVTNVMTVVQGPAKGQRTEAESVDDASITAQVKLALRSHHSTSSVNTKVQTTGGVVTVTGVAKNEAEKTLVTKLATDITGVRGVVNNMTIPQELPVGVATPGK